MPANYQGLERPSAKSWPFSLRQKIPWKSSVREWKKPASTHPLPWNLSTIFWEIQKTTLSSYEKTTDLDPIYVEGGNKFSEWLDNLRKPTPFWTMRLEPLWW